LGLLRSNSRHYDLVCLILRYTHKLETNGPALYVALVSLLLALPPAAPDTLVACPAEFRPALIEWVDHRRRQGHEIVVIDPEKTADRMRAAIRDVAKSGGLKCVVLVGDAPSVTESADSIRRTQVPTNYIKAKVNVRWGSEATIASDIPYADIDDDGVPDLAVGRIPCDTREELAAVVRKIIQYEEVATSGAECSRQLDVVAGAGGFGAVSDMLIEAAGRSVIQQLVPADYSIRHTSVKPENAKKSDMRAAVRQQLSDGGLAWVYLGHGLPLQLDRVCMPDGSDSALLCTDDVPGICCQAQRPLAVLVACYTGAFDAPSDCLAEELVLSAEGPIAAIAATRVSMPYGNTVLGYELLRACFNDRPTGLGGVLQLAQRRALNDGEKETLRPALDGLAQGISPPPVDLLAERSEHVLMYHLLGDPLLRLRLPPAELATVSVGGSLKQDTP
jgi:hypothetical protein